MNKTDNRFSYTFIARYTNDLVIFILVSFGPFFDSVSFNILGRHQRSKAAALGVANAISAMPVEDFTWFFYRWWLPLDNDPKKGLLMQASDWTTKSLPTLCPTICMSLRLQTHSPYKNCDWRSFYIHPPPWYFDSFSGTSWS